MRQMTFPCVLLLIKNPNTRLGSFPNIGAQRTNANPEVDRSTFFPHLPALLHESGRPAWFSQPAEKGEMRPKASGSQRKPSVIQESNENLKWPEEMFPNDACHRWNKLPKCEQCESEHAAMLKIKMSVLEKRTLVWPTYWLCKRKWHCKPDIIQPNLN